MTKLLVFLLFFISNLALMRGQSSAELGVAAIGYVVSDIKASEKFYTEIIGMVPAGVFSLDEKWSEEAGSAHSRPFSVKMFKMVDQPSATILKLAYFDNIEKRPPTSGIDQYAGVNYLTLHFNNLDPVVERIKKAGIKIIGWVKRENYQLLFIKDPDSVYVELVGPPD